MTGAALGMPGQLANESLADYKQRFQTQLALIEAEEQRQLAAEAVRLQAEAAATTEKQRIQAEAEADTQARRKEAQELLQRHEATNVERLKYWHFEPSEEHDDATPEEQHREFMAKLVTRLVYTCNHLKSELANMQRAMRNHKAQQEDAARALDSRMEHLEQVAPRPEAATRDWLTEWQKIAATPDLDLPFSHLRREFYNRSGAALSLALGDREQYATFAEIIDKAREIIKTNRAAAQEKSTWQPTYVEKVKTGLRPQQFAAVQSDNIVEDPTTTQALREGDQVAAVQPRSNNQSRGNGKAKTASSAGNGQLHQAQDLPLPGSGQGGCSASYQLGKLSFAGGEATPPPTPPDSAALLAASYTPGEDANVVSPRFTYEDYVVHLVPLLDQPLHVQQSTACTVSSPSATDSAASPPSTVGDSTSWSRLEELDPLTFADFQWMPLPWSGRLPKPHCNVLMAQLRDYLHTAVPTPLMDVGVEVVDLQAYIAKIDREFKTQRYDDIDAPLLYVRIQIGEATCSALIDCGASCNYMSQDFMVRAGLGPRVQRKSQPTQVTLADGHTHKLIDRCIDDVLVYFAPHASEAVSFDILDTKFDMILGLSWLRSEDHPVNFYRRTVHVRDRNGVLVPCTVGPPHPSINCHVVSATSMRASIIRDNIEEMGVCFLHALPPHDASSMDSSSDPRITELLDAYDDVFEGPHGVVPDRPICHEIILEDGAVPPCGCIYRTSEEELSVLRAQLDDLLEKGWIRPSSSPYGAPVLFVRKKNKDLWLCIYYRKLNTQTIRNVGPLPRIDDLLERLGGAKFFSKLDLKSGYHQLEIRKEDRYKTTFKMRYGHFEWLVMPFGLTNAPTTFQAAMTTEFRHMLDRFVLIYLDDILVYSRSLDEHVEHLRTVLERLRQAKYKANRGKCEFARPEMEYLGHYVTPQGLRESGTKMKPSSARHPQTDGQTERAHQTAQMMLRTLIRPDQKDWVDRLPDIEFAYNTSVHPAIGVTPFELHHGGRKGHIFADLLLPRPADIDAACSPASVRKYREWLAQARANMQKAQVRVQQQANRRRVPCPIRANDLVWVSAEEFALEQDVSCKLLPKWFGPWPVISAAGDEPDGPSFVINIPTHLTVHPIFHASKLATYTPAKSDDFPGRRSQDPPSMDGHQEVNRVITDRKYGSKPCQYKVTFRACDPDGTRWISGTDLKASAPLIYAHYERQRIAQRTSRPAPPTGTVVPPSDRQLRPRRITPEVNCNLGVMSGAVLFIKDELKLNRAREEILVGSLNMVAVVGALVSGILSDAIGRRRTMVAASISFLSGAVMMSAAQSFAMLLVGRTITGIGAGVGLLIAPLYTAELSPPRLRGSLVSVNEVSINVGILLGYVSSYVFSSMAIDTGWRWMLGIAAAPAFALGCGALVLPESPRWLVMRRRINEAEEILAKISRDGKDAEARLKDIQENLGLGSLGQVTTAGRSSRIASAWQEILRPSGPVRKMLLLVLGTNFFQMACGIDAVVYYTPTVFAQAGVDPNKNGLLAATVLVGGLKTIFIGLAVLYLDRCGRRPMMLVSAIGVTCCLIIEGVAFLTLDKIAAPRDNTLPLPPTEYHSGLRFAAAVAVAGICAFVSFFSIGLGPITWVLTSEVFPLRLRAQAMVLGVIVNRIVSGVVAMTFLSLNNAITPAGTFFGYAILSFLGTLFFFFLLPETKGVSLELIGTLFGDVYPFGQNSLGGLDQGSGRSLRVDDPLVGEGRGWNNGRSTGLPPAHPLPTPALAVHSGGSVVSGSVLSASVLNGSQDYDISLNVWMAAENREDGEGEGEGAGISQACTDVPGRPLLPLEIPRSAELSAQKH
ncbi:hypothetical protein CBR_g5698 [Chara braunii]|uniref:Major facilitator superfamily (MFS) profile domain-containing protein n=1 Tax=Chara braunii TaxID=69332 RepID=A0A388JRX5_CHABU|nr:hypothetical protein CBR_g5698 [Chara braunii]|eukprot:GBG60523.1 hypothetical protein CBR_g5698 [Chara braunii]